jgi:hypothetical protein
MRINILIIIYVHMFISNLYPYSYLFRRTTFSTFSNQKDLTKKNHGYKTYPMVQNIQNIKAVILIWNIQAWCCFCTMMKKTFLKGQGSTTLQSWNLCDTKIMAILNIRTVLDVRTVLPFNKLLETMIYNIIRTGYEALKEFLPQTVNHH